MACFWSASTREIGESFTHYSLTHEHKARTKNSPGIQCTRGAGHFKSSARTRNTSHFNIISETKSAIFRSTILCLFKHECMITCIPGLDLGRGGVSGRDDASLLRSSNIEVFMVTIETSTKFC